MYLSGETKLVTAQSKRKRQARKELLPLPFVGIGGIPEVRRVQVREVTWIRPETERFRRGQDETW